MMMKKIKIAHNYVNKELSKSEMYGKKNRLQYMEILIDLMKSRYKYDLSQEEYINLGFHNLNDERRSKIISKSDRNDFIRLFNKKEDIPKLENKKEFMSNFKSYTNREFLILEDATLEGFSEFHSKYEGFIAKKPEGMQGKNIQFVSEITDVQEKFKNLKFNGFDIIEEISIAHPDLKEINPVGLPPIRLMTFIDKYGHPHIIASAIYFSLHDPVVNAYRGASMALIDSESGKVITDALTPEKELIKKHLISNKVIKGFQIPQWNEVIEMVLQASKEYPSVRYVGWDVSISEKGPVLIEANAELPGITGFQSREWNGLNELYTNFELVWSEYREMKNKTNKI